MPHYLAAGTGGYQVFHLRGTRLVVAGLCRGCAVVGLAAGFIFRRQVLAADPGTPTMVDIAKAIQEGAAAYLKRQYRTIAIVTIPLAILVFVTATKVVNPVTGKTVLSFGLSGLYRMLAFLVGAALSGLAGLIGMTTAVRANVRTAAAARKNSLPEALRVAIRAGGTTGAVRGRPRPSRGNCDRDGGPEQRYCHPGRFRFRLLAPVAVHAGRRRDVHQGGRRGGRPRGQGGGGHPRRRPPQPGHHRRQRGGQRGGLRRDGRPTCSSLTQ